MNIATPNTRTTDPETSHIAGEKATNCGTRFRQQDRVLKLVRDHPGCTAAELAKLSGKKLDRYQVNRRTSDLDDIKIKKGKARMCRELDSLCSTWWPL